MFILNSFYMTSFHFTNAVGRLLVLSLVFAMPALAKPKYGKLAKPLSEDASYFKSASKTDFWKLIPYYVPQHNEKACGVASSIMVLNALFAPTRNTADGKNIGVDEIFKLDAKFIKNVAKAGKGFQLDELGETLTRALETAEGGPYTVTVERFNGKDSKAELKRLKKLLAANEKNPNDFVIINYLQSVLTGDPAGSVGHIAPIGAYDAKTNRVLVLDPDRDFYQPYWVPADKVFDAINTTDPGASKKRGLILISR